MPSFRWIPVASPLHDPAALEVSTAAFERAFDAIGGDRATEGDLGGPEPLLYAVMTGGTERRLLSLRERRTEHAPGEPTFLIAHAYQNSLPAALEALARVRQLGGKGRIVYLPDPDNPDAVTRVRDAAHDLTVRRWLLQARLGLIGRPSDWLVASSPDLEVVRETWGPQVVPLDVADVIGRQPRVPVPALASQVAAAATAIDGPDAAAIGDASRVHHVLSEIVGAERLDALTVRCFDLIGALRTSSCVALAQLNDAGVIAGCEGDLPSVVAMLWVHRLLERLPWMANPAQVDEDQNSVLLAHCTVPRSIVDRFRLRTHFESGIGVGLSGDFPAGDVTLVRIGGARMEQLWLAQGDALRTEPEEGLCRTQLRVRLERGAVGDLLRAPLGNHLVVVTGHHADRLREWWGTFIAA